MISINLNQMGKRCNERFIIKNNAANTDTSMKYIQEYSFHYKADEATEILEKGRKIKPAEERLRWIRSS